MPLLEHIGTDFDDARELYVIDIASADNLPDVINFAGRFAVVLLVWNSSEISASTISKLVRKLIGAGGVYFWCVLAAQTHADSPTIDDNATVAEIVETLIKRHGGKNAPDRWGCGTIKFTTTAGILPPGIGTATVTESFAFPSFFKRSIVADSTDGEIDLTFIINKDGGWMTSPGKPTMEIPRAFADRERHTFADICAVAHLRDNIGNLTIVRKLDIDSKPAIQLRLESEDLGTGDYFVDLQSGLLVGTSKQTLDPITGTQAIISTRLGMYKYFEGVAVPMAFSATSDGKKMLDVTIAKLEFKDSLPDSSFTKPE